VDAKAIQQSKAAQNKALNSQIVQKSYDIMVISRRSAILVLLVTVINATVCLALDAAAGRCRSPVFE
jgi:hypothetical protein